MESVVKFQKCNRIVVLAYCLNFYEYIVNSDSSRQYTKKYIYYNLLVRHINFTLKHQ
jgi:hypothetical protein